MANTNTTQTQIAKKETVDLIQNKIRQFQNSGELFFPAYYSPENALKSAWLILQNTVDRDKRPVLSVCTKDSIANCLLSMCIQGLNPDKKQCYFIAYGNQLTLQRSYFGSMTVTKRVDDDIEEIFADVVYKGDVFKYKKVRGVNVITEHEQQLENVKKDQIVAAYVIVAYKDGREVSTIMTMDEIKQAWRKSQMHPIDDKGNIKADSTHGMYTAEMCKKTVVNRACKSIINTSNDSSLVVKYARQTADETAEIEAATEIAENANTEVLDVEYSEVPDGTEENEVPQDAAPPTEEQTSLPGMDKPADPPTTKASGKKDPFAK